MATAGRCSLRERTSCQSRMAVCFGELDVVVPKVYRANVLIQLHEGHPGTTRMKALSRMYVWWPGITVRDCLQCQTHQSTSPVAPLHSLGRAPYCKYDKVLTGDAKQQSIL